MSTALGSEFDVRATIAAVIFDDVVFCYAVVLVPQGDDFRLCSVSECNIHRDRGFSTNFLFRGLFFLVVDTCGAYESLRSMHVRAR